MEITIPLITKESMPYFNRALIEDDLNYRRAYDLRLCLEKICDSIIYKLVSETHKNNWGRKDLYNKLEACKEIVNNEIIDRLHNVRKIGNIAAHKGEEGDITKERIIESVRTIREFSLDVFAAYLKKHGFHNLEDGSWRPTLLSALPPEYRVYILKKYFEEDKSGIVVEKIAMAILKTGEFQAAYEFLRECVVDGHISEYEEFFLKGKLDLLKRDFNYLPIANDLEKAKENFKIILGFIPEGELDTFTILMSTILLDPDDVKLVR